MSASTLSIILATRGRPHLLMPTVTQTLANIRNPDTRLVIAIDGDDAETIQAAANIEDERVIPDVQARPDSLGGKYNARMSVNPADVYLVMVDYAPHITEAFDQKILDAASLFPDKIGVIYNHMANLSFPQINAVTHRLCELMGNAIYPEFYPFWFVDHHLDEIAKMIDRIVVADVWLDTSRRPGTMDSREPYWWATFFDAVAPMRRDIALAILDAPDFQEYEWRKEMLVSRWPLIAEVSEMINESVRNARWAKGNGDHDERYLRIKQRAIETVRPFVEASVSRASPTTAAAA